MKISLHSNRWGSLHIVQVWAVLSLLALVACQSGVSNPTQTTVTRTPEPSPALASLTPLPLPTESALASVAPAGALSPEGPWFFYAATDSTAMLTPQCCGGSAFAPPLYFTNLDGSGRTAVNGILYTDNSSALAAMADPANRMAVLSGVIYLVRPGNERAYVLNDARAIQTGEWTGLMAGAAGGDAETSPELVIYDLPGLQVHNRIPLIVCPAVLPDCFDKIRRNDVPDHIYPREPLGSPAIWSPDGRYLAFAAIRRDLSTDLYLYDASTGSTQEMTAGPEDIGTIWWSPDGKWILFESLTETTASLWAITRDRSQVRQLYTAEIFQNGLSIVRWLDDHTFLTTEGWVNGLGALDNHRNLRLVDLVAGNVTFVYPGEYMWERYDPVSGITILRFQYPEETGWGWVSASDPTLRRMAKQNGDYSWDYSLLAFVYSDITSPCPQGGVAVWTPDVVNCRPALATPQPPVIQPISSPDGIWKVRVDNGLWLETPAGERRGQVGNWTTGQVIWRPDSLGFFLVAERALYAISVPDITITLVDNRVDDRIAYQWLEVGSH